jgi:uncharacterized protein YydD (DUF2326 family)
MDIKELQEKTNLAFVLDGQIRFLTDEIERLQVQVAQSNGDLKNQENGLAGQETVIKNAKEKYEAMKTLKEITRVKVESVIATLKSKADEAATKKNELADCLATLEKNNVRLPLGATQPVNRATRI